MIPFRHSFLGRPGSRPASIRETVEGEDGFRVFFEVDPFRHRCPLEGMDDIDLAFLHEERIKAYEKRASPPSPPGSGPSRMSTVSTPLSGGT